MKNNKTLFIALGLIIVFGFLAYLFYSKDVSPVENPTTIPDSSVTYNNTDYGFTFALPDNWEGYSVVQNTWQGNPLKDATAKESGPKLLIRNPKWTSTLPYEDIPILVFTLKQWDSYVAEDFTVSAAPIPASELARNNVYVFVLPPRWDFDYSKDVEEAQNILKSNPLDAYSL